MPLVSRDSRKNTLKASKGAGGKGKGDHGRDKSGKGKEKSPLKASPKGTKTIADTDELANRNSALMEELKTKIDRSQLQENSTEIYRVYDWKKRSNPEIGKPLDHSSYSIIPDKWVREKFDKRRNTQSDIVLPSELRSHPERRIEEAFNRFRNKGNLGRTVSLDDFTSSSKVGQLTQFWNTLLGNGIEAVEKRCGKAIDKEESNNVIKIAEKMMPKKGKVKLKMPYFPPVCRKPRIRERVFDRSAIRRAGRYRGRRALRQQIEFSNVALVPSVDPSTFVAHVVLGDSNRELRPLSLPTTPSPAGSIPDRNVSEFSFDEKVTYNDVVATVEKLQALLASSKRMENIVVPGEIVKQVVNTKNVIEEGTEKEELVPAPKPEVAEKPPNTIGIARGVGITMKVMMNGPYHEYTENMAFHGGWARVLNPPKEISPPPPHAPAFEELPVFYASVSFDRGDCSEKLAPYIYTDKDHDQHFFSVREKSKCLHPEGIYGIQVFKTICFELLCIPAQVIYLPVALLLQESLQNGGSTKIALSFIFYALYFFYLLR